jgi:hypothetical protein
MALPDLSFIDEMRAVEVQAVDAGRSTSEFALAPGPGNFEQDVGEEEQEALHGRPVDDVLELGERLNDLHRYIELARVAFDQRGLAYPFEIDASRQGLTVIPMLKQLALKVAGLSRVVRHGNPEASKFEKRAFRALQRLTGGWGVCVGAPRETPEMGAEKCIRHYRSLLLPHEHGGQWPAAPPPPPGPIAFYQSKNTGFDLQSHPEEFSRIPAITEDWFGKRVSLGRRVIPVLALNTVLTIELKEKIYMERGELQGVHMIDAVDILAAENVPATHVTLQTDCVVL